MIDIYCGDGNCPICESELDGLDDFDSGVLFCTNGCYKLETYKYRDSDLKTCRQYYAYVFDKRVARFSSNSQSLEKLENAVLEHITYWKQNERYLAKIITGG
ncbi:MAG: hypothetical protein K0R18_519 [Bacillales bacterium]|jgi:hypothetical protein|nr:hypothetical protein [Bacillales bacterium]